MVVTLFETPFYPFGIQMAQKWDRKIVLVLNARNEHDRSKFVEDLKESVGKKTCLKKIGTVRVVHFHEIFVKKNLFIYLFIIVEAKKFVKLHNRSKFVEDLKEPIGKKHALKKYD